MNGVGAGRERETRPTVGRGAWAAVAAAVAVLLALLGLAGPGRAAKPTLTPFAHLPAIFMEPTATPEVTPIPPDDEGKEQAVLALINQERTSRGLPALTVVGTITQAARRHSEDMANHNFFSHTGSDGSNPGQRLDEAGYDWSAWGEIIAAGYGGDPARVVQGWMNSPGHRDIILSATYVHFGAGYAYNAQSTYDHYFTVDFGRPHGGREGRSAGDLVCTLAVNGPEGASSLAVFGPGPCPR